MATTDLRTRDLHTQALTAVAAIINDGNAKPISKDQLHADATAVVYSATGERSFEVAAAVRWAIEQVTTTRLDQYRQHTSDGWLYRFPNGHEASVINDPHRPFRFEVLSDDPADAAQGRVKAGLTSEQVEAKLYAIAALPNG